LPLGQNFASRCVFGPNFVPLRICIVRCIHWLPRKFYVPAVASLSHVPIKVTVIACRHTHLDSILKCNPRYSTQRTHQEVARTHTTSGRRVLHMARRECLSLCIRASVKSTLSFLSSPGVATYLMRRISTLYFARLKC
jgi:hypothetical protein